MDEGIRHHPLNMFIVSFSYHDNEAKDKIYN